MTATLDPELLWNWVRLFSAAAARFETIADAAAPGSRDYLELLSLADRCRTAGEYAQDAMNDIANAEATP